MIDIKTPLKNLGGSYKLYTKRLEKLGIYTLEDFIYHIPSRYEDFSLISPIASIQPGEQVTIQGTVTKIKNIYTKRFKTIQQAEVSDASSTIEIVWFNQPFLTKTIRNGDKISLSGQIEQDWKTIKMVSPDFEILYEGAAAIHTGRLVPIYPETKGVSSKWLRRQIFNLLHEYINTVDDYLPENIREEFQLMKLPTAIMEIHFPVTLENAKQARQRLGFDELFILQLQAKMKRREWEERRSIFVLQTERFKKELDKFWENIPFEPTNAQHRVINEIFSDLAKSSPMNRLLQGDVGSGKTVVAAIAMYISVLNGYQSILMAPTEILAQQHFKTISELLSPLGVKTGLMTSSIKNSEHNDIYVGTHALLAQKQHFDNAGLIVIDEQQRFGVEQRAVLKQKSKNPHLLTMTATPIPRTVALTIYGNLDLSVIDEMPKDRKKIKTWLVPNEKRDAGYKWIEKQILKNGDQAFIVCPFIEESENMTTVKAAAKEFERLQKEIFPDLQLELLHGKMKSKEKERVILDFKDKKTDILIATPVVEVGIDFPNATIIVIEAAERFGLAQLHQLRGRVGRGDKQSYCLLYTDSVSEQARKRISSLEKIHNGAALAEFDFKMRGPGNLYGVEQSGYRTLKAASFSDTILIQKAKHAASKLFSSLNTYPMLRKKLEVIEIIQISPD